MEKSIPIAIGLPTSFWGKQGRVHPAEEPKAEIRIRVQVLGKIGIQIKDTEEGGNLVDMGNPGTR